MERCEELRLRCPEAQINYLVSLVDRILKAGKKSLSVSKTFRTEDLDAVDVTFRCDPCDDPGARGSVTRGIAGRRRIKYHSLPADFKTLQERVSDEDGSLAAALEGLSSTAYLPSADFAAVSTEKSRTLRGAVIRRASLSTATDDTPPGGLAFTNYVLRLPGEDKITGNEDDWVVRDGVVMKLSEVAKGGVGMTVSAGALEP